MPGADPKKAAEASWAEQAARDRANAAQTKALIEEERAAIAKDPGLPDRWLEAMENAENADEPACPNSIIIIAIAFALIVAIAGIFASKEQDNSSGSNKTKNQDHQDNAESENVFALSSDRFHSVYDALWGIPDSTDGWAGDSGTRFADQNTGLRNLIAQIADVNQEVDTTVQTENTQVNDGRETLGNVVNELDLAMPVAQSLYFSGPAGPAMSYSFQLAVASPAVNTGADTTSTMHENSQRHGERLTALLERYDAAFRSLPSAC